MRNPVKDLKMVYLWEIVQQAVYADWLVNRKQYAIL